MPIAHGSGNRNWHRNWRKSACMVAPSPIRYEDQQMIDRTPLVPILLLVAASACSANRAVVTTSIPAPLVTALINDRGAATRPSPDFAVGSLPKGYPSVLVPSGPVTIVGGMTNGDEIVAVFADSTRRLAAVLEQLFGQAGFTRPPPTPGSGFMARSGPYSYFCKDSATVAAEPLTGANRNLVRVNYHVVRGQRACATVEAVPSSGHGLGFASRGRMGIPAAKAARGAPSRRARNCRARRSFRRRFSRTMRHN